MIYPLQIIDDHEEYCHCESCHDWHKTEKIFEDKCWRCNDEKCSFCYGSGYINRLKDNEYECPKCKGVGRI